MTKDSVHNWACVGIINPVVKAIWGLYLIEVDSRIHSLVEWLVSNHIGDIASISGVFVSLVGFVVLLINVARSKSAADRAEKAANAAQRSARLFDTLADASKAISMMDDVKRLNREGEWNFALDRYSEIKKILIEIRSENPNIEDIHQTSLQSIIGQSTRIENIIESTLASGGDPSVDVARFNKILSRQTERLNVALVEIKAKQNR